MGAYPQFDDTALLAEIAAYRAAIREASLGGGVGVVAGENRRIEINKPNVGDARTELRLLLIEARKRGLDVGDAQGGAILVRIG